MAEESQHIQLNERLRSDDPSEQSKEPTLIISFGMKKLTLLLFWIVPGIMAILISQLVPSSHLDWTDTEAICRANHQITPSSETPYIELCTDAVCNFEEYCDKAVATTKKQYGECCVNYDGYYHVNCESIVVGYIFVIRTSEEQDSLWSTIYDCAYNHPPKEVPNAYKPILVFLLGGLSAICFILFAVYMVSTTKRKNSQSIA